MNKIISIKNLKNVPIFIFFLVSIFLVSTPSSMAADVFEVCNSHAECVTGSCGAGRNTCFCAPSRIPGEQAKCMLTAGEGMDCSESYECLSGRCEGGRCTAATRGLNESCGRNEECTAGACVGGKCICGAHGVCELKPGETPATPIEAAKFRALFPAAENVPQLVGTILKTTLAFMGSIALLFFVYGGITWLTSGGSPDRIKKAQGILVWATIGLAVIFGSYAIVDRVIRALGG